MKNIKTFEQHTSINENLLGELQRLNPERLKNDEKALDLIDDIKEDFLENGEDLRKVSILDDTTSNEISFSKIEIGKSYTLSYVFGKYHPVVRNIYSGNREAGDRRIKIVAIPFSFTISRNSLESLFRANRINLGTVRVTDVSTQHNYQRNPNIGNHALYKEKEDKYTRNEYNYASFSRTFTLPENIKAEKIDARYENGELMISLPKLVVENKATTHKKIEIK
jgi:hypothetical protein